MPIVLSPFESLAVLGAVGVSCGLVTAAVFSSLLARKTATSNFSRLHQTLIVLLGMSGLAGLLFLTGHIARGNDKALIGFLLGVSASLLVLVPTLRAYISSSVQ
jgi:FtsH-binding integral membrane protein